MKKALVSAFTFLISPELRPFEVRAGRYILAAISVYLGVKGVQAA